MKGLHQRSRHNERYDFDALVKVCEELAGFIVIKKNKEQSIDFGNPEAVRALNKGLLKLHYQLAYWEIPQNTLCPAIPGRAEYIHALADLFGSEFQKQKYPKGPEVKILDIGTGASLVYPLVALKQYGWSAVASEVNSESHENADAILKGNEITEDQIQLKLQKDSENIFRDILDEATQIDAVICNPPFHRSKEEAAEHTQRKWRNLGQTKGKRYLNFGGQSNELWYRGGERIFVKKMIQESQSYKKNVLWFSSLVSKKESLPFLIKQLEKCEVVECKEIELLLGNKKSRILTWSYFTEKQRKAWADYRWS